MSELERRLEDLGRGILEADRPISLLDLELAPDDVATEPGVHLLDDEDVVELRPTTKSRRRWQIFLAACVVTFIAFLPFLLARSPDDEAADSTNPVTTPDPARETPVSLESLGVSESFPTAPGSVVSGSWVRLDGVYYGRFPGGPWMSSADGLDWTPISADSDALPPNSESGAVAFHQTGTETYATVTNAEGVRVLEWEGGEWVQVPATIPTPPEGVRFIPDTEAVRTIDDGGPAVAHTTTYISRPTMVVLRDGVPVAVGRLGGDGGGTGIVTAGGVIYGIAKDDQEQPIAPGEPAEFTLWRSDDGAEWSTVDLPGPARGELGWAYLTAGHDRLMLSVGVPDGSQLILTSTDGETWEEVELPMEFTEPALPQATDFGWMIQTLGGPEPGWFQHDDVTILVSPNGLDWEKIGGRWGARGGITVIPGAYPVVYEAGLFARKGDNFFTETPATHVWRIGDATSPDDDTTDTTISATTPDPESVAPLSKELLGVSRSLPTATLSDVSGRWVLLDGVYYGRTQGRPWMTSADGLNWTPISADSNAAPPASTSDRVAFHQLGTQSFATVMDADGGNLRVLEWAGGKWVEVPVTIPTPPEGVRFNPDTAAARSVPYAATYISRPTMVVLRDGYPVTVGRVGGDGAQTGMVAAGGIIYGIAESDPERRSAHGEPTECMLWRSDDGVEWSTVDLPGPASGDLGWAYVTAGHDRLMLTVGVPDESGFTQLILTSTDGETWEEVELPMEFSEPALPQATDFGWMIQHLGGPETGWYQYDDVTILISPNGLDWESDGGWEATTGGVLVVPSASPVVYEAGLFARKGPSFPTEAPGTYVWRIIDE
jgi:hypothetical protein